VAADGDDYNDDDALRYFAVMLEVIEHLFWIEGATMSMKYCADADEFDVADVEEQNRMYS
jgi:hypothetical protein